jgi:hypothetical protein
MKNILLIFILVSSVFAFGQKKSKETVYLLFDNNSTEKFSKEDGSGNFNKVPKFRKEKREDFIYFRICNETFTTNKVKSFSEIRPVIDLEKLKTIDLNYLLKEYESSNEFKQHVFDKIFVVEKIKNNQIKIYEVSWLDEVLVIED